ncbi:MAG TPA: PhoH family protein [Saccharofermentans sp.]|jgi:phosphate starvation-inducible PhoH-like protein|nr:PhoH family protein [Clostridia bacterium]HPG64718.1 PhoH family protein [Saccharofermentans sp.]HUM24457.1 PhoH family protein [Saccharofermentans sp.]
MNHRITDEDIAKICISRFLRKISESFGVSVEVDGDSVVIDDENSLNVHHASKVVEAMVSLSKKDDIDDRLVDYLIFLSKNGSLEEFITKGDEVIITTPTGRPIKSKTLGQRFYIDAIKRSELVICSGPAGSGKTFLGVAMAVKAFKSKEVSKIILCRPAIEAGERLGFLPGDIEEKINPYMRPIYDALETLLGQELFVKYLEKGLIEVSPLAFMRGRNLDDAFVLLDEAQNTTNDQMKMFLTRIGMNCKACVCGDFTQIDLPYGSTNGLRDSIGVLEGIEGISIVSLSESDIVRNPLVQRIVSAYAEADVKRCGKERK